MPVKSIRGCGVMTHPNGPVLGRPLAVQIAVMALVFALALFLPAGTWQWPEAWLFLALMFGFTIALSVWLLRHDPALLSERMTGIGRPDQEKWDKILLSITAFVFFAWLVVMGLDARFRWSRVPLWLEAVGALLLLLSFRIFFLTFRENAFLSPAVRIQTERAHRVVRTGLYRHVRHPMYAGFVLFAEGTALLLGSWYGALVGAVLVAIIARRAVLEERLLREKLTGYVAYMDEVRYRFLPGVW
jgi:protein-S-isoprenylcysteine O-methyltransferase Ste14